MYTVCVHKAHSEGYNPPELASETQTDGIMSSGKDAQVAQNTTMMMIQLLGLSIRYSYCYKNLVNGLPKQVINPH